MRFWTTPFEIAWDWMRGKVERGETTPQRALVCPDCQMPVDEELQKSNVRIERGHRLLSCPWCWQVISLGEVKDEGAHSVAEAKA